MDDILYHLPDPIALLDETANISKTNKSWDKELADTRGLNFLELYDREAINPNTTHIHRAIQQLIAGESDEYSSALARGNKRFSLQIVAIRRDTAPKIMVTLRDITALTTGGNDDAKIQIEQLTETNIALNSLLKSRELERTTLEEALVANVRQLIMPYMDRLANASLAPQEQILVTIIKEYLDNIISPFLHRISNVNQQLTPQELKIASLIRQGRSSKEIGEALNLSVHGVGFHRKSLRTKLGLTGSGKNLRSQLMALR